VEANGTGEIAFNFGNTGSDPLTYYADQYLLLTVTLSYGEPDNVDPVAGVSGTASEYFTWTYDAGTYMAHQNSTIPAAKVNAITAYVTCFDKEFMGWPWDMKISTIIPP
jgi:hypothetical protein